MNFVKWNFSKEVQLELKNFLDAVKKHGRKDARIQNVFREIYSELSSAAETKSVDEDIVMIDVSDNGDEEHIYITQTVTDLTALNITSKDAELLNPELHGFIEHIKENIEAENGSLTDATLKKMIDYNSAELNYLFSTLFGCVSDQGLYNLSHSLGSYSEGDIINITSCFCKNMLLPKLVSTEPTHILQLLVKEFGANHSQVARTELFIPLMKTQYENTQWFQVITNLLSDTEKQLYLRDFVYASVDLEPRHLPTLQFLVSSQTEDAVKRRLINLMEVSADKFAQEKLFIKLLITVIQSLGKGFEDQEQILYNIVEKNNTLLKISAQKALAQWATLK